MQVFLFKSTVPRFFIIKIMYLRSTFYSSLFNSFTFCILSILLSPSLSAHLSFQLSFSHSSSCINPPSLSIFLKDWRLKIACLHLRVLCHLIGYSHTSMHTGRILINVFLHHLKPNSLSWKHTWSQKIKEHWNRHPSKKSLLSLIAHIHVYVCVCVWSAVNQNPSGTNNSIVRRCKRKDINKEEKKG